MSFGLFYLAAILLTGASLALGFGYGWRRGHDSGWDEGYDFATTDSEIRWQLTAAGEAAVSSEREALAELKLHTSTNHER